jgi:hypothetical protein
MRLENWENELALAIEIVWETVQKIPDGIISYIFEWRALVLFF